MNRLIIEGGMLTVYKTFQFLFEETGETLLNISKVIIIL